MTRPTPQERALIDQGASGSRGHSPWKWAAAGFCLAAGLMLFRIAVGLTLAFGLLVGVWYFTHGELPPLTLKRQEPSATSARQEGMAAERARPIGQGNKR